MNIIQETKDQLESLKKEFSSLRKSFFSGELDRYVYISKQHEFNKLLLEYSSQIKNTEIESIKIFQDSVVFKFKSLGIELETDGAARSAPFEILNFGSYEPEDESLIYRIIENGNNILDIGANIGWYTLNFAKRFPQSKIYVFEPIPTTFEFLSKNVQRNNVENVTLFNCGLSNLEEEKFFYYFKGGSAIASIENLINHQKAMKVKCQLKTLDNLVSELKLESVDFIKCDVEGSELFVLQGGEQTIRKFLPVLFIELCEEWCKKCGYKSGDIIHFLQLLGYKIFQAIDKKLKEVEFIKEENGRYNYFFFHVEKHKEIIEKYFNA